MNASQTGSKRWLLLSAPACLVLALLYGLLISPKLARLGVEQAKLDKLSSTKLIGDLDIQNQRQDDLRQESTTLSKQLDDLKLNSMKFVAQNLQTNSSSPAQAISKLVILLEQQGMRCVGCTSNRSNKAIPPEESKINSTARANSTQPSATGNSATKQEIQIELEGTFVQLQSSLAELRSTEAGFEIVAISMSDASAHSSVRSWKLRVLV